MIPFGDEVVTLYHKEAGKITRHSLRGCSWRAKRTRMMIEGAAISGDEIICRYADGQRAAVGDLFVRGNVRDAVNASIEFAAMIERYPGEAFLCSEFADYRGTNLLPHYCARGSG